VPKDQTNNIKSHWPVLAVAGIAAIVYWPTACRSVGYIDSGELATNCYLLGIPHPTGYPLYVILGRLATLFFPGSVIFRCNLLSSLVTAMAAGALFLVMVSLPVKIKSIGIKMAGAAAMALFMAFSPVWWSQGISNEVYGLTLLLSTLAIYCLSRYSQSKQAKFLLMGLYLWGLSFTVHLSSLFLFFAFAYIAISIDGWKGLLKPKYYWGIGLFVMALTLYAYIPIRAAFTPFLNWSAPQTWQGFMNHLTGWQYRVWMFNSVTKMFGGIKYFGQLLYGQFGIVGLLLIVAGLIGMIRSQIRLAIFFGLIVLADVIYSSNYEIYDIESYYLPAIMCLAIFAFWGVAEIYGLVEKKMGLMSKAVGIRIVVISLMGLLPLANLIINYSKQDYSRWKLAEAGAENIIQSIEPNGIAFIENWDFYSPWLYKRFVENERPEAVLIDRELMRRSWYLDFLQRNFPDLMAKSRKQAAEFKKALVPFESGGNYDGQLLTSTYEALIQSIIDNNMGSHPIYANFQSAQFYNFKQKLIPMGGLFRLRDNVDYVPFEIGKIDIGAWEISEKVLDERAKTALDYFYRITKARAGYCHQLGHDDEAQACMQLGLRMERLLKTGGE
jgi:hypothetical protein